MEPKALAITPPLLLVLSSFFFHLRGAAFGSSKALHCLLLLSCLLLSSLNTLHNLADSDYAVGFNGGVPETVPISQNVCPSSHLFSFLSALGLENQFDPFGLSCPNKSWSNSALPNNNNLSGLVWLSLRPLNIIEFQPQLLSSLNIGLSKEFYSKKNTGELSLSVLGKPCGGNEFMVHHQYEPIKFLFFYHSDPDFNFSWSSGIATLAVPVKATSPVFMLSLCKKPVFGVRTKKLSVALVIAAALLVLIFCFNDHFIEDNNKRNDCAVSKVDKSSTFTISPEMDSLLRSISNEVSEKSMKPTASASLSQEEAPEAVNLTVKTAKDKRRRRNKKKKKGGVSGLTPERTDVSSSYSENSTPRSPMSPEPPTTQAKPPKPVLTHSATFPVSGVKSMIIQRSSLALNVRAPGAKSRTQVKDEYMYDIWGDHLTGLNLMDRFKEVREGKSSSGFGEDECESFFVKGPQSSHAGFVSFYNQWG